MMMECPRCGFAQPKDRYCASCGLDVEHYVERPKPLWIRFVQNPNTHLSLIVLLICVVVGYIFYAQRGRLGRQVGAIFKGSPLSSREAADKSQKNEIVPPPKPAAPTEAAPPPVAAAPEPADEAAASAAPLPATAPANAPEKEMQRLEVTFWEIPRETLANLMSSAEKVGGESNEGHAYLWADGAKIMTEIQAGSRRLSAPRALAAQNGAQLTIETPPGGREAFQFGLYFQLTKSDTKEYSLKWESSLVLPQIENPNDPPSNLPQVKALNESTLSGVTPLTLQNTLMIVFEPANRSPRQDYLNKAGDGPWNVFASEEFHRDLSDWIAIVQPRVHDEERHAR